MILTATQKETERVVISALIKDPHGTLDRVGHRLKPTLFIEVACRNVFNAVRSLDTSGSPIDVVSIVQEMQNAKTLESSGGPIAVSEIFAGAITSAHLEYHVTQLESTQRSNAVGALQQKINNALENGDPIDGVIARFQEELSEIQSTGEAVKVWTPVEELIHDTNRWIAEIQSSGGKMLGLPTGFRYFDRLTGGLQPGRLYVIAGRPGDGKSAWLSNVVEAVSIEQQIPTAVVTLEMPGREATMRLLVQRSLIGESLLTSGALSKEAAAALMQQSGVIARSPCWVCDISRMSIDRLCPECRRIKRQRDVKLLVIDYLQLMEPTDRRMEKRLQIAEITMRLKGLAKELDIPILVAAQLNREADSSPPQLRHFAESASIERDADVCIMIETGEERALHIRKNRCGPLGSIKMDFEGKLFRFSEVGPIA